jgi:hypothetical protein
MQPTLIAIFVSSTVTIIGLLVGYTQWRRDIQIKLGQIRETVSVELIRQRIEPYAEFYRDLEMASRFHEKEFQANPKKINEFMTVLQNAVYGKIGLLASHETRLILLYVKSACIDFMEKRAPFAELQLRLWALHLSLRSDLGISQPQWSSEIERIRTDATNRQEKSIADLVKSYPWDTLYPRNTETLSAIKNNSGNSK